jgi:hypothetical protein
MVAVDAYDMQLVSGLVSALPPADGFPALGQTAGSSCSPVCGNWMSMEVQYMGSTNPTVR